MLRLAVAVIVCGAYINSRLASLQTDNFVLLQLNFHLSLLHAIAGKSAKLLVSVCKEQLICRVFVNGWFVTGCCITAV